MSKRITIEELQSYLWNSAVLLRTNIDAGAYKQYIFPLLFFKRICDVYDEETAKAVEEYGDDASEFDEDEIHTFIVPKGYHWKEVLEAMCLTVHHAPLPDGVFGRTYFNNATVDIYDRDRNVVSADIEEGTILVDPDVFFMRNIGSVNNTIIHECVHWDKHYKFFELQKLINPELTSISCAVVEEYKKGAGGLSEDLAWMEWQANAIAPKILIPAKTGRAKLSELLYTLSRAFPSDSKASIMQLAISEFADFFKVSTMAAKIRAIELGFDQAAGVFNYVDGQYYPPFSFAKGSLKKDQTFIIDRNNAIIESLFNQDLAEDFKAGRFIHAGGMMVINDPKYVVVQNEQAELTEYALAHVDECCLVFDRTTRVSSHYDDSFYNIMAANEEYLIYRYLIDNHHMENILMWNAKLQDAGISQQLPKNGNKLTAPEK